METRKPEYQHFIPQFLLRNFSHKYVPPDKANRGKPKKRGKKNKMYPGDDVINSLSLSDDYRIDECLVRRVCGVENMYVDTTKPAKEQGKLEKKFGVLENRASCVYRKIIKAYEEGKSTIWLKRSEKDILRKFIFLLTYRGEQYHRKYNLTSLQEYDDGDKELLQEYMTKHGFTRPIDVWLQSLETIIDFDMDAQGAWRETIFESIYSPIADFFVSHICGMYMAICTPTNPDEEFVLTDNCYNVTEGPTTSHFDETSGKYITKSPRFHMFAPISPRLMLVLRNEFLPEPNEDANPEVRARRAVGRHLMIDAIYGSGTNSMMEDLPVTKATNNYTHFENGMLMPNAGWNRRFGMNDEFCFKFTKISTSHFQKINGLLIDHAFHGSRVVFNRKDAFIDLVEWYLTEPCEVGKNLVGEHAATQAAYIEGLSQFMLREGRALEPKVKFWPSEHRDLRQHRIENLAGARFLEETRLGETDVGSGFDAIYERLGGTMETYDIDRNMSMVMFAIWAMCVDLDWESPDYGNLRSNKLDWLLDRFFRQQPCVRFWMFLKRMRLAQSRRTPSWAPQAIHDRLFFEICCSGPEDMLAYSYPITSDRELSEAMYKSFNNSMDLISGPGRGLESMGYFSLFSDPSWRIPTPGRIDRWPWNRVRANDGPDLGEEPLASLVADLRRMASIVRDKENDQSVEPEVEDVDTSELEEAAQSELSRDKATETPTKVVQESQPDDLEETQEVPDALRRAARAWFLDKEDETPAKEVEKSQQVDDTGVQETPDALRRAARAWFPDKEDEMPAKEAEEPQPVNENGVPKPADTNGQVHPEQPQNETRRVPREWYSRLLALREAYRDLDTKTKLEIAWFSGMAIMLTSAFLFLLGSCGYLLSYFCHSAAWILRGLAWLLDICLPVYLTLVKYYFFIGLFPWYIGRTLLEEWGVRRAT